MFIGEKFQSVHIEFPDKNFATLTLRNSMACGARPVSTLSPR